MQSQELVLRGYVMRFTGSILLLCFAGCGGEGRPGTGAAAQASSDFQRQGTKLQGTKLQGTKLQGTKLQGTKLQGTALQGTWLVGQALVAANGPVPPGWVFTGIGSCSPGTAITVSAD